ncbi:MAG: glycosyl hydrolase family 18 protein, partial [Saprospiraceae bacterium]|nr:glycosyl hydrolase family 18 protein [Saprospiraceae bacterium]
SNLYPRENYDDDRSAKKDLDMFIAAGVPPGKLVLGLPFYGRSWILPNAENHGIHQIRDSVVRAGGYTFIKDSLINRNGFVRYWDENAQAPYLFNEERNQLIVYDDEGSVKIKCHYVLEHDLAGVMFWQYMSDPKEYLLDAINASLK